MTASWPHTSKIHEILKPKHRYKLIDVPELSRLTGFPEEENFPEHYAGLVNSVLKKGCLSRDDVWTQELAVGSKFFVDYVRKQSGYASPLPENRHILREQPAQFGPSTYKPSNLIEWAYRLAF